MAEFKEINDYLKSFISISQSMIRYYGKLQSMAGKYSRDWEKLQQDEKMRLQFFTDLQNAVVRDPYNFSLEVSFELKSVRWMEQEIINHLERMDAKQLSMRAAINFVWDIERSHIRDQSCRFLRTDIMSIKNQIREISSQTEERKSILMGIYYEQPGDGHETRDDHTMEKRIVRKPPVHSIGERIALPHAAFAGAVSLEESLLMRRSIKEYSDRPVSLHEAAQILWAGQGITDPRGFRTAPSGMALFPLDLRLVAGNVEGLPQGVYRYDPFDHELERTVDGDRREELAWATYDQDWMKHCAFLVVVTAFETPAAGLTPEQVERFVCIEAGHVAQNIFLQSAAFGLGMVGVGHFGVDRLGEVFRLKAHERPVYVLVGGRRK